MLLVGCALAGGCNQTPTGGKAPATDDKSKAVAALKTNRGKELQGLELLRTRELVGHLKALGLERDPEQVDRYGPWHIWDFGKQDRHALYLLCEAGKKMKQGAGNGVTWVHMHPSATPVTLTLVDETGNVVTETDFTTGWRCYLREAEICNDGDKEHPLVLLHTELGGGPGPDITRQYYAWLGDRFDLVRLENSAGKATRNRYSVKRFRSGPRVVELTEEEWETELMSSDRTRVLRAMVWLGGYHWNLHAEEGLAADQFEDAEQVKLWRKVRARAKVLARIQDLVKSEDGWLREAAELVADDQDGH